jgi:hypothetical protein
VDDSVVVTSGRRLRVPLLVLRAALLAVVALAGALVGCTSRTLPLPPPDVDPIAGPDAAGLIQVTGTAQEGAAIGVFNESAGHGVIVTSSDDDCDQVCEFEAELPAEPGDALRIWQFFETRSAAEQVVP